jgi:surface antigen
VNNPYPYGQCTWWCADQEPWCLDHGNLGNALDWAANWRERGGFVQLTPAVGCIACFQPGSNGADAVTGHVAVVISVKGSDFTVSEMNGPNGPGHTDDRACVNDAGVSYLVQQPPTPEPMMETYLASTGVRPAGETKDPHGDGAVYLISCGDTFKRWITSEAILPTYVALYGPINYARFTPYPYALDHMVELAPIDASYPALGWLR